ncbi:MAG: sigma-70 family RNA polymerase sigma factor [Ginsengibacter sp.]
MEDKVSLMADDETIAFIRDNKVARRQAENQLFKKYAYLIKEGMNKYSLEQEDAFTAYSDTILQSINNITSSLFEERSSLKTYLYKIFNNKCVDLIRKKTTNKRSIHQTAPISEMMDMISDQAKNVIQQLIEKNDFDLLRARLNELGDNCKKMLLFFADGYNDKDIAVFMEYKTADVVKTSRLRCMDKLRKLYN